MNERLPFLQQKTSKLTISPGVYLMKNKNNDIIYIGKAKNLKNRVSSYFRHNSSHTPKVLHMVENVYDYDFIVTDSEYEALILECSLIKQHKPKYNILLKDDKGYFYIKISNDLYPKITAEKNVDKTGEFFGPYTSSFIATQTVDEVNKVFKLPTCKYKFSENRKPIRPCLNFHINQCIGLCHNDITPEEFNEIINQAKSYIQNGNNLSIKKLQLQMDKASENLDFEKAARISAITKSNQKQKIFDIDLKSCDFIASSQSSNGICISLLIYRNGRLFDKLIFSYCNEECDENYLESFLIMYYTSQDNIPKNIVLEEKIENVELIKKVLCDKCNHNIKFSFPQKGNLLKYIMMAKSNAEEYLSVQNGRTRKEISALEELSKILGLKKPPEYIEAYDISNLSSSSMVAGMVVFKNGRPFKKAYKRFAIKDSLIQNDYACMQEVIERRFNEYLHGNDSGFITLPDLILLDGGKGHVNAVLQTIKKFNLDIPIYGLVMDSHRFAISYMKTKHTKNSFSFELTKVKGIGSKKAQKLILEFKTKENLKKASPEELSKIAGVNSNIAEELYNLIQNL